MQTLVGIIRTEAELERALMELDALERRRRVVGVEGHRQFNPGWHLALDLRTCSSSPRRRDGRARSRKESRGGHTRDDFPAATRSVGKINHVLRKRGGELQCRSPSRSPRCRPSCSELVRSPARADGHGREEGGFLMGYDATMRVWRGDADGGDLRDYSVPVEEGMVVLDARAPDPGARRPAISPFAGTARPASAAPVSTEINGKPRLACMTRHDRRSSPTETITVTPLKTFPLISDLVTDVSFNYEMATRVPAFKPQPRETDGTYRM